MKSIPGWKLNVNEISNVVFKVTVTALYGSKSEVIDIASDETIESAISGAFDIEKQVLNQFGLFLYEFTMQNLTEVVIKKAKYDNQAFGSWFIETKNKRLILDGRDNFIILEQKMLKLWIAQETLQTKDISYNTFKNLLSKLEKDQKTWDKMSHKNRTWDIFRNFSTRFKII